MTHEMFGRLLYEDEGVTLDFKKEQYKFAKASDEEKSELLKDILGFANSWRRAPAYILIGVQHIRGGQGNVIGIPPAEHIDDHSLQQFVNNLTNQPVLFRYEAFGYDGKQIGIIQIEEQIRPIYLKKDYGKLKKWDVYVRRGSSTDPTKPAAPDEIARMGSGASERVAEIKVEFAKNDGEGSLGAHMICKTQVCDMPASIPELTRHRKQNVLAALADAMSEPNRHYYKQLAQYEQHRRFFCAISLVVTAGQVAAKNVRLEFSIPADSSFSIMEYDDLPTRPKKQMDRFPMAAIRRIRPVIRRDPGEVVMEQKNQRISIEIDCRDLQPGRSVTTDTFFVGRFQSGDFVLTGRVLADNLPRPQQFDLTVSFNVAAHTMSVEELLALPEPEAD